MTFAAVAGSVCGSQVRDVVAAAEHARHDVVGDRRIVGGEGQAAEQAEVAPFERLLAYLLRCSRVRT
jgi:hypothetical protein